jgi:hypothetical protein
MAIITLNNNSLSSVTALPAGVGGKVLQVVKGTSSTQFVQASPTNHIRYYPSSNKISLSITPSSTSSKIIIQAIATLRINKTDGGSDNDISGGLAIKETISGGSTTEILPESNAYDSGLYISLMNGTANIRMRLNEITERTPSTTSEITYEVGLFAFARTIDDIYLMTGNSRGEIIAYEVAG